MSAGPPAGGFGRGGLPPRRKSLGQHFLSDQRVLSRIADAVQPHAGETVVEIGPGAGALTDMLADRVERLVAVEVDRALVPILRERYAGRDHVSIVEADALSVPLGELAGGPFVLVGNVPYYITTPLIFHALENPRPRHAVYLIQREVADRLAAAPGSDAYGALTVNVGSVADVEMLFRVPPSAFRPPPKVESAVVRITPRAEGALPREEEDAFRSMVQRAFGMRRKQMRRVVRGLKPLDAEQADTLLGSAGIEPTVRPEVLSLEQFVALWRAMRV